MLVGFYISSPEKILMDTTLPYTLLAGLSISTISHICLMFDFMKIRPLPAVDRGLNTLGPKRADQLTDVKILFESPNMLILLAFFSSSSPSRKKSKANRASCKKNHKTKETKNRCNQKNPGATAALMAVSEILTRLLLRQVKLKYHPHLILMSTIKIMRTSKTQKS